MLIEQKKCCIVNSKSPLQFYLPERKSVHGNLWYRYLTIDGKGIFNTGNVCDNCCPCYFEYQAGDEKVSITVPQELSSLLNAGINSLDDNILQQAQTLIPEGEYFILLYTIKPKLVVFGDENDYFSNEWLGYFEGNGHNPKIPYYRLQTKKNIDSYFLEDLFIECLVPVIQPQYLDKERIAYYQEQYSKGVVPTALSVAIWDHKFSQGPNKDHPSYDSDISGHQLLAHYIVDGHHKVHAAALESKEITLLAYIRKDNYFDYHIKQEEIDFLVNPNEKHERDVWLEIIKDPKADIAHKVKAIESLSPYFKFDKVKNLMINLVISSKNKKLAYAAGMLVAKHWKEIYEEGKEQLFSLLHTSAQDIITGNLPNVGINARDEFGKTALMSAARDGNEAIIDKLIQLGADINAHTEDGRTALMYAASNGHAAIIDKLIHAGADINTQDAEGKTALMYYAAGAGHEVIVDKLIQAGADVNARDKDGYNALHWASANENEVIGDKLIQAGADINAHAEDGSTALMIAALRGRRFIVGNLIQVGADVNIQNKQGETALMNAVWGGNESIVDKLIQVGAGVNIQNKQGETALMNAVWGGNESIVDKLIQAGADVNAQNEDGDTALIRAVFLTAWRGQESILDKLMQAGADINIQNRQGQTALMIATECGRQSIINKLKQKEDV